MRNIKTVTEMVLFQVKDGHLPLSLKKTRISNFTIFPKLMIISNMTNKVTYTLHTSSGQVATNDHKYMASGPGPLKHTAKIIPGLQRMDCFSSETCDRE